MNDHNRNELSREIVQKLKALKINIPPVCECPNCKLPELNTNTGLLNFDGFKVMDSNGYWWSHCFVCNDWF